MKFILFDMENSHAVVLSLLFSACLYTYIQFINPLGLNPSNLMLQNYGNSTKGIMNVTTSSQIDALELALSKASVENKTVILAIVNKAYVEQYGDQNYNNNKRMLDLFLDGFWFGEGTRGLIDHLLLVAVDQTSFERCEFLRLRCFKLEADGLDFAAEKVYMSSDFINMMWTRTRFLGDILRRGYSFIFTDTDVIWLRNPFPKLSNDTSIDLQISVDSFNGDPTSKANPINTGFYMVRSNNKTVSLFESWYARKNASAGMKEQDVLQDMMREGAFKTLNLTARFLDTLYFSGFCQASRDFGAVATVHANCCRTINAKVADLTAVIRDWRRFRSLLSSNQSTAAMAWSSHEACVHSWRR